MTEESEDLERMQGTWAVTTLVFDGKAIPTQAFAAARIVVEGDRFTSLGMGDAYSGSLKLDSSANPRSLDMHFDDGPERGNTNFCIYEITSESWKLCVATRGLARPQSFVSPPGSDIALETLERDHNSTE